MSELEYHSRVRHWISASVAVFALFLALGFVSFGQAQVPGAAAAGAVRPPTGSVIPMTGSVRPPTGIVPGQAIGLTGHVPNSHLTTGFRRGTDSEHHRRRGDQYGAYGYVPYAVAIPYAPDGGDADNAEAQTDDNDPDYQGGPTVFDRRGLGAESYVPPIENAPAAHSEQDPDTNVADEAPQPSTILVFKDGHKLEVGNYAILGDTLFDLTPGHSRKVALAALNLDATRQLNDDRGVIFQLPASAQGS